MAWFLRELFIHSPLEPMRVRTHWVTLQRATSEIVRATGECVYTSRRTHNSCNYVRTKPLCNKRKINGSTSQSRSILIFPTRKNSRLRTSCSCETKRIYENNFMKCKIVFTLETALSNIHPGCPRTKGSAEVHQWNKVDFPSVCLLCDLLSFLTTTAFSSGVSIASGERSVARARSSRV